MGKPNQQFMDASNFKILELEAMHPFAQIITLIWLLITRTNCYYEYDLPYSHIVVQLLLTNFDNK